MIRIHVLDSSKRYWAAVPQFFYPLYTNRRMLADFGVECRFYRTIDASFYDCHAVFVSSRHYSVESLPRERKDIVFHELSEMRRKGARIVWFDDRDSTGCTQFEVLDWVDLYLKKQLLKSREAYRIPLYGARVYTDYFHKSFGVVDEEESGFYPLPREQENKVGLSWNISILDLRPAGSTLPLKLITRIWRRVVDDIASHSENPIPTKFFSPLEKKDIDLLALFNVRYRRNTVAFQRQRALEILAPMKSDSVVVGTKVPRRHYFDSLQRAKIVLSLFGWGEICWREMEAFAAGAAVMMPDMDHLETWPDLYLKNETYASISWDLSDLIEVFHRLKENEASRVQLAEKGQAVLRWARGIDGREALCRKVLQWAAPS